MLDSIALAKTSSASQHDTYLTCPRKWGFRKLDGIKPPANRFAERGKAIHANLESWLTKGVPIDTSTDYGKMAAPGIKHLPPPGTGFVEHRFRLQTQTGIYLGDWDLWVPHDRDGEQVPYTAVYDHKTTTDFRYIKRPEVLRKDSQAVLYAVAAMSSLLKRLGLDRSVQPHVDLNWVYYRASASKPGSRRVQLHVLPDGMPEPPRPSGVRKEHYGSMHYAELEAHFNELEKRTALMLDHHRQGRKGMDLPYDLKGCKAYGGCPYQGDPCKLSLSQLIEADLNQEEKKMDLSAKMKAAAAAANNGAQPAPTTPAVPKLAAGAAASQASPEAKSEAAATTAAAAAQAAPAAVNPPEAAKGVDPDAPRPDLQGMGVGRLAIAGNIASGLVSARIFPWGDPNYADQVGHLSVEIADAIIKAAK